MQQQGRPPARGSHAKGSPGSSTASSSSSGSRPAGSRTGPQASSGGSTGARGNNMAGSGGAGRAPAAAAGEAGSGPQPAAGCPLRKWLGPLSGLVFNQYDKLVCPPAIVAARAALARTAPVKQLRPQALPVKLVAVAAVVAGINIPCGAVREHFEKFSVGWFVAVHATIPFVAMLRKAVIMPKYAILATIAAAVMGQVVGSRLERMRLQHEREHGPLLPLPPVAAVAAAAAAAAAPEPSAAPSSPSAQIRPNTNASSSSNRPGGAKEGDKPGRWSGRKVQGGQGAGAGTHALAAACRGGSSNDDDDCSGSRSSRRAGFGAAVLAHLPVVVRA